MNQLEQRVKEAFDALELPLEVRSRTLAALDKLEQQAALRPSGEAGEVKDASTPVSPTDTATLQKHAEKLASFDNETPAPADSAADVTASSSVQPRPRVRARAWRRTAVAMAACFLVAAVGLMGARWYFQETAFIDIDVNPSITLGLNRFDIVVSATPLNPDGEALLKEVSLTGKSYDSAMSTLTNSVAFSPYIKDEAFIAISVASEDEGQAAKLCAQSDTTLSELPCEGVCGSTTSAAREAAHAAGMGSARYHAAEQLIQFDPSLSLEECASMSMRELRTRLADFGATLETEGHYHGGGGAGSHRGQGVGGGQGHGGGPRTDSDQSSGNGDDADNSASNERGGGKGAGKGDRQGNGSGQGSGRGRANE